MAVNKVISAKDIEVVVMNWLCRPNIRMFTIGMCWELAFEADVLSINKNDYWTEYEIKRIKSDFRADFMKRWNFKVNKHKWLVNGDSMVPKYYRRPNSFYFVVPEGMVTLEEVPEHCGLIYITKCKEIKVIRKAPILHKTKVDNDFMLAVAKNGTLKLAKRLYNEQL